MVMDRRSLYRPTEYKGEGISSSADGENLPLDSKSTIWLGSAADNSSLAIELINRWGYCTKKGIENGPKIAFKNRLESALPYVKDPFDEASWKAFWEISGQGILGKSLDASGSGSCEFLDHYLRRQLTRLPALLQSVRHCNPIRRTQRSRVCSCPIRGLLRARL